LGKNRKKKYQMKQIQTKLPHNTNGIS
jgi:hypothetical protein